MDEKIPMLIKFINDRFKSKADAEMKELGLTFSQMRVLGYLIRNGGTAKQKEVEDYLHVSHPTVVGLVSRLEASGYITSKVDSSCRRNKILFSTEKAMSNQMRMEKERKEGLQRMLVGFSETEKQETVRLLEKLYENMKTVE